MDLGEIYHFLFETYWGVGVLVLAGLILSFLVSIILEKRTKKIYYEHQKSEDDWSIFEDDDEEAFEDDDDDDFEDDDDLDNKDDEK